MATSHTHVSGINRHMLGTFQDGMAGEEAA